MPNRFSPLTDRIAGRGSDAWAIHIHAVQAKRRGEDVVVLTVGDPDLDTPDSIREAAIAAIRGGDTHYTDIPGRPPLRAAIAERHAHTSGTATLAHNVMVTPGAQNALFVAASCLLAPGDRVLVLQPAYVTYHATFASTGAEVDYADLPAETGFRVDADRLRAAIRPETRAIAFSNPNNPTGCVMSRAELETIMAVAREHDLWVIADEVYGSLVYAGAFLPAAALDPEGERVVTIESLSKAFAMTGWRCGWLVGPGDLIEHAERLALAMLYGVPSFIQTAALAALTRSSNTPAEMAEIYRRRRDLAYGILREAPGLRPLLPEAGMFMMVDVRGTGLDAQAYAFDLLGRHGVAVLPADAFGPPAEGFVRLSFASSEADIEKACRRMKSHALELSS